MTQHDASRPCGDLCVPCILLWYYNDATGGEEGARDLSLHSSQEFSSDRETPDGRVRSMPLSSPDILGDSGSFASRTGTRTDEVVPRGCLCDVRCRDGPDACWVVRRRETDQAHSDGEVVVADDAGDAGEAKAVDKDVENPLEADAKAKADQVSYDEADREDPFHSPRHSIKTEVANTTFAGRQQALSPVMTRSRARQSAAKSTPAPFTPGCDVTRSVTRGRGAAAQSSKRQRQK